MASENETVASISDYIRHMADNLPNGIILTITLCNFIADRIEAAQKREVAELRGEKIGILKANASLASDNDRLRREVSELNEVIDANLRVHKSAEKADADAKLELNGEIVMRDAVIAELRECLKEACRYRCGKCNVGNLETESHFCGNYCDTIKLWRNALEGVKDGK